jgi:hypothetical protein
VQCWAKFKLDPILRSPEGALVLKTKKSSTLKNALAYYNAGVVPSCKFLSRRIGSRKNYQWTRSHRFFKNRYLSISGNKWKALCILKLLSIVPKSCSCKFSGRRIGSFLISFQRYNLCKHHGSML